MKKAILLLAVIMMAATSYNQTSRRSANNSSATSSNTQNSSTSQRTESRNSSYPQARATTNSTNSRAVQQNTVNKTTQSSDRTRPYTTTNRNSTSSPAVAYRTANNQGSSHQAESYPVNRNASHAATNKKEYTYSPRAYKGEYLSTRSHPVKTDVTTHHVSHHHYRKPVHVDIYWTNEMRYSYTKMYPGHRNWNYEIGYRISTIPAGRAYTYAGNVMRIYGRVQEVFFARQTDEYFLYIGDFYPYQEFTVIVPGNIARRYNRHPDFYFENQYITATGLITRYNGEPELVVQQSFQLDLY